MNLEVEKVEGELSFLRFFYQLACDWYSNGGTDEESWIKDEYVESGKTVPVEYESSCGYR